MTGLPITEALSVGTMGPDLPSPHGPLESMDRCNTVLTSILTRIELREQEALHDYHLAPSGSRTDIAYAIASVYGSLADDLRVVLKHVECTCRSLPLSCPEHHLALDPGPSHEE